MENFNVDLAWDDVCTYIKGKQDIDIPQFNAFFSRLHPQAMSVGFLMLTADTEWIKNWVELHYISLIKEALRFLYNEDFNVLVAVDELADPRPVSSSTSDNRSLPFESSLDNVINQGEQEGVTTDSYSTDGFSFSTPDKKGRESNASLSFGNDIPNNNKNADDRFASGVTSSLTFENFVIGDSNRMAYSMAVAVAETPGKPHLNPLFIYGKSGLGKTHLLRAIQNYIIEAMPWLKVIYIDANEFVNDYTDAVSKHDIEKDSYRTFMARYENADVLLIDDVQYFQGKRQTLEIVFQIFKKLTDRGKQVVLSADRAPKNIDIDDRYKSRFNQGATFDIQPPEFETKLGIIKIFIEDYKLKENKPDFTISDDIQHYVAEISSSNIRELKSAVTNIIYQMIYSGNKDFGLEEVKRLLENHFSGGASKRLSIADIQKEVESYYKVSHNDLIGKTRSRDIVYARQIAIYLCRQLIDIPYNDIGKKFGGRDHSTVLYSYNIVEDKMKENREIREEIEILKQIIRDS